MLEWRTADMTRLESVFEPGSPTSHPASSSSHSTSKWPMLAASATGPSSESFVALTLAPLLMSHATSSFSPERAASCSAELPFQWRVSRSTPSSLSLPSASIERCRTAERMRALCPPPGWSL